MTELADSRSSRSPWPAGRTGLLVIAARLIRMAAFHALALGKAAEAERLNIDGAGSAFGDQLGHARAHRGRVRRQTRRHRVRVDVPHLTGDADEREDVALRSEVRAEHVIDEDHVRLGQLGGRVTSIVSSAFGRAGSSRPISRQRRGAHAPAATTTAPASMRPARIPEVDDEA